MFGFSISTDADFGEESSGLETSILSVASDGREFSIGSCVSGCIFAMAAKRIFDSTSPTRMAKKKKQLPCDFQ